MTALVFRHKTYGPVNQVLQLDPSPCYGQGITGLWMFTQPKSPKVHNIARNSNNLTVQSGATIGTDIKGRCFKGSNSLTSYATTGTSAINLKIGGGTRRTILLAFKANASSSTTNIGGLFSYGDASASNSGLSVHQVNDAAPNNGINAWCVNIGTSKLYFTVPNTAGVFHTLAVTYDQTTLSVYVDGNQVSTFVSTLNTTSTANFDVGRHFVSTADVATNYFNGSIFTVGVSTYDMTAVEVREWHVNRNRVLMSSRLSMPGATFGIQIENERQQISGAQITSAAGTIVGRTDPTVNITGASITSAAGGVKGNTASNATAFPVSQVGTGVIGSVIPNVTALPTALFGTGALGTITVSVPANVTVNPVGIAASGVLGTPIPAVTGILAGVIGTGALGQPIPLSPQSGTVILVGLFGTMPIPPTLKILESTTVSLVGLFAAGAIGTPIPTSPQSRTVTLTGIAGVGVSTAVGVHVTQQVQAILLTGLAPVTGIGSLVVTPPPFNVQLVGLAPISDGIGILTLNLSVTTQQFVTVTSLEPNSGIGTPTLNRLTFWNPVPSASGTNWSSVTPAVGG